MDTVDLLRELFRISGQETPKEKYKAISRLLTKKLSLNYLAIYHQGLSEELPILFEVYPQELENSLPPLFDGYDDQNTNIFSEIRSGKHSPVGYVLCEPTTKTPENIDSVLHFVGDILFREFEKDAIEHLFREMINPLSLNYPKSIYSQALINMAGKASGVQFAALRTLEEDGTALVCDAVYCKDHISKTDCSTLKFTIGQEIFSAFTKVMESNVPQCSVFSDPDSRVLKELTNHPPFEDVKTIVVAPLNVGGKPIGTISFGIMSIMDFTEFERSSFLAISNWAGAALNNYIESQEKAALEVVKFDEFFNDVRFQVQQGIRHGAMNSLAALGTTIKNAHRFFSHKNYKKVEELLTDAHGEWVKATRDVYNMRLLAKQAQGDFDIIDISTAIDKAEELLSYPIIQNSVKINRQPNKHIIAYADRVSLQYVFVNLILNSIEAFNETKRGNRRIDITLSEKNEMAHIELRDNAGGLRKKGKIHNESDAWLVGNTSKENGTGLGLPYARMVIQADHKGTIHFTSDNNGIIFYIELPKNPLNKPTIDKQIRNLEKQIQEKKK